MQIVIEIPDNYDIGKIENGSIASKIILNAVKNGTPLPKGHGRLIDADALLKRHLGADYDCRITRGGINHAPTIIEADKESEE